ncbi:Pentatricopeptide repeat-containing protein At4g14850 [Linum perenne]
MGRRIQGQIFRHGFDSDVFVQNGLVTFYAKRGEIELANKVFGRLSDKTIVTWTSMISGYAKCGQVIVAKFFFDQVESPKLILWNAMISGYAKNGSIADAGKLFDEMPERNIVTWNAAFDMYSKTGSIADAGKLFDEMPERNIVTWNAYISNAVLDGSIADAGKLFDEMPERNIVTWNAYISNAVLDGRPKGALQTFREMPEKNLFAWNAMISGYAHQGHADMAIGLFREMASVVAPNYNGLIDFYGKCKEVGLAEMVFDGMERRNLVTWGSMVATYEQNGEKEKACIAFMKCRKLGIEPTDYVISSVVSACAELAGIELGRSVHALAVNSCVDADVYVGSALVDMYGKCGSIHDAEQTFREMPEKNLFAWNAMISGYAHQGHADMAIGLFREMASVVAPNYVTFVCVLSACSRGGAVETGMDVYESMMKKYGIEAGPEHYACVVDMLARSGLVERAYDFVQKLPIRPTISIWGALLNACRVHGKPEIGKIAADNLFELDPKDSGNHVLLSNMFAVAGR